MATETFTHADFTAWLAGHNLMGARCRSCGALYAEARPMCPDCFGDDMAWEPLSGHGKLAAFTTVYIAPTAMIEAGYGRDNPYVTGIVALDEGPSISGQIVGVDVKDARQVAVGMPLQATFVTRGEGDAQRTFLAFEPAPET
ncbi:MAG: Zn-ribbon domain-containing OB-fold protein [Caldilineales bacterium]